MMWPDRAGSEVASEPDGHVVAYRTRLGLGIIRAAIFSCLIMAAGVAAAVLVVNASVGEISGRKTPAKAQFKTAKTENF